MSLLALRQTSNLSLALQHTLQPPREDGCMNLIKRSAGQYSTILKIGSFVVYSGIISNNIVSASVSLCMGLL